MKIEDEVGDYHAVKIYKVRNSPLIFGCHNKQNMKVF